MLQKAPLSRMTWMALMSASLTQQCLMPLRMTYLIRVVMIWCRCGPRSRCLLLLLLTTCWARSMEPRGRSCSARLHLIEGSFRMSLLMLCSAVFDRMGAPSLFAAARLGLPSWPALPCGMTRRSPPARTQ